MKVWMIQPGIAPYRIPLFEKIAETPNIDLTVAIVCEQVPGQPWNIDYRKLKFKTRLVSGINRYMDTERQIQFAFPLLWQLPIHRPDLVICSGFTFSTLLVWICSKIFRLPYVIWNEGTEYSEAWVSGMKTRLRRLMAKSASAFIIAGMLSEKYTKTMLSEPHQHRFYLSYNAVDIDHFRAAPGDSAGKIMIDELRSRLPRRNILHVGKLNERKGIIELMDAYRDLASAPAMRDVGLVLCGVGPLEQYVRDFVAKHDLHNVFIEGFVPQDRLSAYYSVSDVFVLLSRFDCNPLVIFEALSSGIPIVCSYRAGNAIDFISEGENGFCVDPHDHEFVVNKIIAALDDVDKELAKTVSRKLVAKANYTDSARAFIDAIQDVMR